jgi:hypothetical protein
MLDNIKPDFDTTVAFLHQHQPGGPWNLASTNPDKPGIISATFTDLDRARAWLEKHSRTNLYFASNAAPSPSGAGGRVKRTDVPIIAYIHADLDVDKQDNDLTLNQRKVAKVEELNALPPTIVIDSGGGLAALWQLDEPVEATPENIEWVESANRWMVDRFGADKQTTDLGRLLRLPGTINFPSEKKRERGRVVAPTKLLQSTGLLHGRDAFGQVECGANSNNVSDEECDPRLIEYVDSFDDLGRYGLPGDLLSLIENGHEHGQDRSARMFHAACGMIRCGMPVGPSRGCS